jgi:hypothetical protein
MRSSHWQWIGGAIFGLGFVLRVLVRCDLVDETTSWVLLGLFVLLAGGYWFLSRDRYVDYVFEPQRPDQLPSDTYRAFDSHTPEFMQLGCGLVGDFRLASNPRPTFVRYFLPQDRRMYGEIRDVDGTFCPSFTTVFQDGRLLETIANSEVPSQFDSDRLLWAQSAGSVSIAELHRLHRQAVDMYEQNAGIPALIPTAGLLGEFAQYGHRLVWADMGKLPARLLPVETPRAQPSPLSVTGFQAAAT